MNCAIISRYPFPYGLAASNRIFAYSKGLVENDVIVKIYLPFPNELPNNKSNKSNSGNFKGIDYCFTSGRYKSKYKLFRGLSTISRYRKIKGYLSVFYKILFDNKKHNFKFILLSYDSIPFLFVFSLLAKLINSKSIFIFDEYPTPIRHKLKTKVPFLKEFLYRKVLKHVDAYISISENLKTYYNNLCPKKTFILSNITDTDHFKIKAKEIITNIKNDFLCYMGNMELEKDNVDIIIKAFSIISPKYPNLELHLYGSPSNFTLNFLTQLSIQLNVQNKVKIKGKVDFRIVPSILKQALILVSSQPDTKRASGGFPTKLGEYLIVGKPVIMTNVGENSKYIKDKEHAFFTKPNDPDNYAKTIDYILSNYNAATKIAKNGQKLILQKYSSKTITTELIHFLNKLYQENE